MSDQLETVDEIDREILRLLGADARQTAEAIAKEVDLSATAVRRRIARMEDVGVIVTYTVVQDHKKIDNSLEAYIELEFAAGADVNEFLADCVKDKAVREASALAGHPDAIIRVRVPDVGHLEGIVMKLRQRKEITRTNTLVAF